MALIKIISGTYGHRPNGSKHPEPKRAGDPPFEVGEAEAKRLVALKVADYVKQAESEDEIPVDDDLERNTGENGEGGDAKPEDTKPEYSVDMDVSALRELMKDCGLAYKVGMSKADAVAALDAYYAETEDEATVDDDPEGDPGKNDNAPDLAVEEPVT